jgi:hypothetical protein
MSQFPPMSRSTRMRHAGQGQLNDIAVGRKARISSTSGAAGTHKPGQLPARSTRRNQHEPSGTELEETGQPVSVLQESTRST